MVGEDIDVFENLDWPRIKGDDAEKWPYHLTNRRFLKICQRSFVSPTRHPEANSASEIQHTAESVGPDAVPGNGELRRAIVKASFAVVARI
jgi:hypothetical protein